MPRKKRNQRPSPPDLTVAILVALRQQLPDLSSARLNEVALHLRTVVDAVHREQHTRSISGGRPRKAPLPAEELKVALRSRIFALTHPLLRYVEKDEHGKKHDVEIEGELHKRYKAHGVSPDTKTKWAADTEPYLAGWWERANWGVPPVPYPAEQIAERLGPHAPKGTGSLTEVARFVVATRWGIKPETLRGYLKK